MVDESRQTDTRGQHAGTGDEDFVGFEALAHLHHAYFLGLQLMVSTRCGREVMGDWMFKLFRRQHLDKFLSSFTKLGLDDLPHAVACAKYHVLSNGVGGVPVEYMYESDTKAWVRFRYPRWMYHGPTICGVTEEVSTGFLRGWYAYNGVSLGNPRLGYVCVSQDMTGEFGLCGYFKEYDHDLSDDERLVYAKDERPPVFREEDQPSPPDASWNAARLAKANRNYAVEYVRNGLVQLTEVIGAERCRELADLSAKLIGMQYAREIFAMFDEPMDDPAGLKRVMARLFRGMGDRVETLADGTLDQGGLRVVRGLDAEAQQLILEPWAQLFVGMAEVSVRSWMCNTNWVQQTSPGEWVIDGAPLRRIRLARGVLQTRTGVET